VPLPFQITAQCCHLSFDTECISRLHSIVTSSKEETPLCKRLCVKEFTLCKSCNKFSPSTCSQISSVTKYVVLIFSCLSYALQGDVFILYLVSLSWQRKQLTQCSNQQRTTRCVWSLTRPCFLGFFFFTCACDSLKTIRWFFIKFHNDRFS